MQLPYSCSSRLHIILFYSKLVFSLLLLWLSWGLLQGVLRPQETVHLDEGTAARAGAVGGERESESGPLILLWNRYQETGSRVYSTIFARITSGECQARCRVTTDKTRLNQSQAVVFHMPDLHWEGYNYPKYRDPAVPWILMTYESMNSVRQRAVSSLSSRHPPLDGRHLDNVMNRTMTLRTDSDIVVRHGFVTKRSQPLSQSEMDKTYSPVQWEPQLSLGGNSLYQPVVAFISHCNDFVGRMKYIHILQRRIGVAVYGACGPLSCGKSRNMGHSYSLQEDPCFNMVNKKYRFYLSFENAICRDYVTEKIFNALRLNTIPVVLGGADYSSLLPPHSFIDARDHQGPEGLAKYLHTVLEDQDLYDSYFTWRPHYDIHSFTSVPDNCGLCESLASGSLAAPHTYTNMFDWLVRGAQCQYTRPTWGIAEYRKIWTKRETENILSDHAT